MSANQPPKPYFNNINFNPSFFSSEVSNYLTEIIANAKYLKLSGGTITGNLRINGNTTLGIAPYAVNIIPYSATSKAIIYTQNNGFDAGEILLQPNQNASVGIGTTATLGYKLYVGGQAYFAGQTYYDGGIILGYNSTSRSDMQFGNANGTNVGYQRTANEFSTSAAIGDLVIRAQNKLIIQAGISYVSAIMINTNNYINIGNGSTIPTFPITLNSTLTGVNQSMSLYSIGTQSTLLAAQTTAINPALNIGLIGTVGFNSGFYIYSDKRIKKDIKTINNSLEIIDKINPVSYKYIDFITKGNIKNYGVIAQEIEEIIPEVVNRHKDFIPNIYKNVDYYDNDLLRLYIKYDEAFDLSINDKIKIYDDKNKEHIKLIKEINFDYITIDSPVEDYEDEISIFIHGKEIEDVKNVNYEALFMINVKATQELYQQMKQLLKRIEALEA